MTDESHNAYLCEFPYTCTFTIAGDGHNTEVTIRTRSQEMRIAQNEQDLMGIKDLENSISKEPYAKHITEFVRDRLWYVEPRECQVEYSGDIKVSLMTKQDIKDYRDRCLRDE